MALTKCKGYSFYTIKEILKKIESGDWILPIWQRDYVWKKQDIIALFDSLYRKYPIGNILLWKTKFLKNTFCEFKTEADYRNNTNMTEPSKSIPFVKNKEINAILDGQQRLTTLFLALSNKAKINQKNELATTEEQMYIHFNILSDIDKMSKSKMIFRLSADDFEGWNKIGDRNKDGLFMRLDHIFDDDYMLYYKAFLNKKFDDRYLITTKKERQLGLKNIKSLRKALLETKICVKAIDEKANEAFEIFNRLNSSGAELSATQLSTCKLIYLNEELKNTIHADLKEINGNDFEYDISYIVNFLYLLAYDKLKEKNNDNDDKIVKYYKDAKTYTKKVSRILSDLGLGHKIITSYNAILPIAYYLYKNRKLSKITEKEEKAIKYYMLVSMIKGLFGGSSKDANNKGITEIKKLKNKQISIDFIKKMNIKKNVNNNFIVNKNIIDDWLTKYKKGDSTTKLILYILYENYHYKDYDFHEDHMQPASEFRDTKTIYKKQSTNTQMRWVVMKDQIPNLQLLESKKILRNQMKV